MKSLHVCMCLALCTALFAGCQPAAQKKAQDAATAAQDAATKMNDAAAKMQDAAGKIADDAKNKLTDIASQALDSLKVGDVNLGTTLTESLATLSTKLAEIKDADTARAALPSFEEVGGQLEKISGLTANLPEQAKIMFATLAKGGMGPIKQKIEEVLAMAGVGDVLKPVLDGIVEKLTKLAG